MKTITLFKGAEVFRINYAEGDEPVVLDELVRMVNAQEFGFDWFDAAILSHQVGQHLAKEVKPYLPKGASK